MKLSPEKQKKFALTLLIVIGVIVGLWYALVNGLQNKKTADEKQRDGLQSEIKKLKTNIVTEKNNREKARIYQAYIANHEESMPKGNPETWLVKKLTEMAALNQLKISNTLVQPVQELSDYKFGGQPYILTGFRFDFRGDFNQIGKFLQYLENEMPLMEVDDLSITAGSPGFPYIHTVSIRISMVIKS